MHAAERKAHRKERKEIVKPTKKKKKMWGFQFLSCATRPRMDVAVKGVAAWLQTQGR